ncbi:hypothetical protein WJX73_003766 [Symbiochloris irregularis]|uniref:Phosphomannomutase n=1 Tax=Symbiochloris irregularis TaxID=706552 RepID=A0AAW1P037_9CHLO
MVMATSTKRVIALFDVDGTLSVPRRGADQPTLDFLQELRKFIKVGIVGGSDLKKISEQLGAAATQEYDYLFAENGLVAYAEDLDIPIKRGTFIEFRNGMLNISPIGRNCSQQERDEFEIFDRTAGIRKAMVAAMQERFKDFGLTFSIGGQISFDAFPTGWDKTYCLQFIDKDFDDIHFFGDKTFVGGNDHEIFESPRTIGHTVNSPIDTLQQCKQLFIDSAV